VDLNRIGLVQMKLGWTWPIWPIGPVHRPTSPGSTTPGSPLASLPHPTNPNPNRSPLSRDSESPAALPHDSGEPRCRLPMPQGNRSAALASVISPREIPSLDPARLLRRRCCSRPAKGRLRCAPSCAWRLDADGNHPELLVVRGIVVLRLWCLLQPRCRLGRQ
jgi:hypothetical protein